MAITSTQDPKILKYKKLLTPKGRQEQQLFIVEGYHLVKEAIKANIVIDILEFNDILTYKNSTQVTRAIIKTLSTTQTPQNIIAICKIQNLNIKANKIIALNKLQDPGNIGTIFRLAKSFGFDSVIVENIDIYNEKIIRSSQGAMFSLNIIKTNDLSKELSAFKKDDFLVYSTTLNKNSVKLNDIDFRNKKIVIVLGNEGNGIDKKIIDLSDFNVYVPIEFESLNVACCGAIIMNKIYNGDK